MARVITFSRQFPAYHPRKGQPTHFVEKIHNWWWENANEDYCSCADMLFDLNIGRIPDSTIQQFIDSLADDSARSFNEKLTTIRPKTVKKTGEVVARWKAGDKFSPRVWSGAPYNSPQIIIAPDIEVVKTWDFDINESSIFLEKEFVLLSNYWPDHDPILDKIAKNDGLSRQDLIDWFKFPKHFDGQIICWSPTVNY